MGVSPFPKTQHATPLSYTQPLRTDFVDAIYREGIQVHYGRRKKLFREGDRNSQFYLIKDGWVALSRINLTGARQILDFILPSSCILTHCAADQCVSYSAECITDVTAIVMSQSNLERMIQENPEVAVWITQMQHVELERAFDHLTNIGSQPGLQRVAFLLSELHTRTLGKCLSSEEVLPLRQQDIASAVGITSVYANQILKKLQKENAIKLVKGKPAVIDSDLLFQIGEFDATK